jgi:thiamine-phosphate pyrophosphorylase
MTCDKKHMLLYAVTDRTWTKTQTLYEQVEQALKGGITMLQLREKSLDDAAFFEEAINMKILCAHYNVPFIINDNIEVALRCKADGIHVGQSDMQAANVRALVGDDMILGVSVATVEQALEAERNGANYLGVGAVFPTGTKLDACDVSHALLKEICAAVSIPVVAIGGISKQNMLQLSGSGVDGVALVSAIFASDNIEAECKKLCNLAQQMVESCA